LFIAQGTRKNNKFNVSLRTIFNLKKNPEYNVLKVAGSPSGRKHTEETLQKMVGRKNSALRIACPDVRRTHRNIREETKTRISKAHKGKSLSALRAEREETPNKISASSAPLKKGTVVEIFDLETNETSTFSSMSKAAKALGVRQPALSKRFKTTSCFCNGRY
jgi:group I intron endonuclease